jgi:predicted NBD/HSP70 family sugar kinase
MAGSNLATILELVHHGRASSRAELTALTGLNRSTVGALVAELGELGLVEEGEAIASGVGRPSPTVRPAADGPQVIAINPEVDAVTGALVGLGGRVRTRIRVPLDTVPTPEEAVRIVHHLVDRLTPASPVTAMGLAIPGLVRAEDGLVRWAPHLGWRDVPFAELLTRPGGEPVVAGNDASLGAVAEQLFGAGRGVRDLVYLNGGASGIGGGVIVRGEPLAGRGGYAGEFGQNRPGAGDRLSPDGTLEDEVSRTRVLALLGLADADEPTLASAIAGSTDAGVAAELARQRGILAVALGNAVNVFDPERVVLGGYLATLLEHDPEGLARGVRDATLPLAGDDVDLVPAALGEDRLLIGAAELAFAALLRDPASWRA